MNILCVAATEFEIAPFLKARPASDFLITGVGVPMAVYHILKRIHQIDYDLVIQAGIAGSFSSALEPGRVVFVKEDHFADLGILEQNKFSTLFEAGFLEENETAFNAGRLENHNGLMDIFPFEKVCGVTVNTISDNAPQIEMVRRKFNAQVETMEGAALHYTCILEKIPFIQLRSISNYVGERDKLKWKMKEAIEALNDALCKIVTQLTSATMESSDSKMSKKSKS